MPLPIEFPQQTVVLAKNQPGVLPLPVYVDPVSGLIWSCWQLSPEELARVAQTGVVWVGQVTNGQLLQPQCVDVNLPFRHIPQ